jgi:hypothetical protein
MSRASLYLSGSAIIATPFGRFFASQGRGALVSLDPTCGIFILFVST